MSDTLLHDTRDRVVALGVRFDHLEAIVEKNSRILAEIRDLQEQAKGGARLGRFLWDGGKLVAAAVGGSGAFAAVQHWLPKAVLAVALTLVTAKPVAAWTGWVLEVEACGEWSGCRKMMKKNLGSSPLCDEARAALMEAVPGSPSETWGFPQGTKVRVTAYCSQGDAGA